jgi:hypothetical protein
MLRGGELILLLNVWRKDNVFLLKGWRSFAKSLGVVPTARREHMDL